MRCALYLRVSTDEQTTDNQRPALEDYARARGWDVALVFAEAASAVRKRPQFEMLLAAARRRSIDLVLVWSLDRLGRSMHGNISTLLELDRLGVRVASLREAWLDSAGPTRDLLIAIFSWVAQQEREQLVARTVAGMQRARREGKRIGRPPVPSDVVKRARELHAGGLSVREVAEAVHRKRSTIAHYLKDLPGRRPKRVSAPRGVQPVETS
jgi:putative DNA-invertase from lambdoid prophage Rac